jgi:hypothetical protein
MALKQLMARPSAPLVVYNDNGRNLEGAAKEFGGAIAQRELHQILPFFMKGN